jgi:hypothetical protein
MAKGRWTFKLSDVQRAIKAVKQERLPVSAVRIGADGTIMIDTHPTAPLPINPVDKSSHGNPWDRA